MSDVVAVRVQPTDSDAVLPVAEEFASLFGARTLVLDIAADAAEADGIDRVLGALAEAATVLGVLPNVSRSDLVWPILQRAGKPVALAPAMAAERRAIARALVPLDGTPEAAAALTATVRLLSGAGVQVLVLHVFEPATVPRYWDQQVHAESAWAEHFAASFGGVPGVQLQWRTGKPAEGVLEVARNEDVDLIAVGWRQHLEPGRARTLRSAVAESPVPVLIVPVAAGQ